jgi:hypothetical protein
MMAKGRRKKVGEFEVDDRVIIKDIGGRAEYTIESFPSRRTALLKAIDPKSEFPSTAKVQLSEIEKVEQ